MENGSGITRRMCSILREIHGSRFFLQLHCGCVQEWMKKLYKLVAFYVGYSTRSKWSKYWTFRLSNGYHWEFGLLCFGLYFNNNYVYFGRKPCRKQKNPWECRHVRLATSQTGECNRKSDPERRDRLDRPSSLLTTPKVPPATGPAP